MYLEKQITSVVWFCRYAFSIAAAVTPEGPKAFNLRPEFMAQPPWDKELNGKNGRRAALIHYTYSNDFDPEGTFTPAVIGKWHFDKRDYIVRLITCLFQARIIIFESIYIICRTIIR